MTLARIHLDPIGGIAGDMFVAAMADAFPEHAAGALVEVAKISPALGRGQGEGPQFAAFTDGLFRGHRFIVARPGAAHAHTPHREIRARLETAGLEPAVLLHALGLFELLAQAEGAVHGIAPEKVEFHEVGAWDSIADFVAAAHFVAALAPVRWTIGPLPLGGGRVSTAHGVMPVPAPATTRLLEGMEVIDDGVAGERVTPTGAAIARYLCHPDPLHPDPRHPGEGRDPMLVVAAGHGFGTRRLPGMPNLLRVLGFAQSPSLPQPLDEEIAALEFEIDDQSAEDLAVALDRLREAPGVLDASQSAVVGKKGRLATRVQVLARLDAADAVADQCLSQTTTLGVRIARVMRRVAQRASVETAEGVRVKLAARPTGAMTAKAEMDDLARIPGGRAGRERARRRAEDEALKVTTPHGHREDD